MGLLFVKALLLGACLTVGGATTPTPEPPSPSPTASVPFPTLAPTSTRTPPPSPTATPDLVSGLGEPSFQDDFSQDSGWDLGENVMGGVSLVGGRLAIAVRQPGASLLAISPAPESGDFFVEVTIRAELCRGEDEFGLAFRTNRWEEHYRFTITCDGGARARRILQDSSRALVPFTKSPGIFAGPLAENRLGIWSEGADFQFFVNGVRIFEVHDSALPTGGVGFFVRSARSGQTTVTFDNLILRPLLVESTAPPDAGTPTPP